MELELALRARWPWRIAVSLVAIDLALLGGLAAEGSVLARPGGVRYVLAPLAALIAYAAAFAVSAVRLGGRPWARSAVRVGALAGALTAVMWIASHAVETFAGLSGWSNIAATAPLLLGAFVVWALAGSVTAKRTGSVAAGVLAAVCGAMVCVTATIGFGLVLVYVALPTLERGINGSPEYLASHWGNLHAFAIANSFGAAFTHLTVAPIIAALVGIFGALARRPHALGAYSSS